VLRAYVAASADVAETLNQPVPLHLRNAVTGLGRAMGYGTGYRTRTTTRGSGGTGAPARVAPGHRYYDPSDHGAEEAVARRLESNREALDRRRERS